MCEKAPRKLTELTKDEQKRFLESFDWVFSDVDGVLWELGQKEIEGVSEAIKSLRKLGKKLCLITNNSTVPLKYLVHHRMKNFDVTEDEVIRPALAVSQYLKNKNFDKEVYVVGTEAFKDSLRNDGFKVICDEVKFLPENVDAVVEAISALSPNVGAVVIDFALNVNFLMLQKCIEYIKRNDVIFIVGAWDPVIPFRHTQLLGTAHLVKAVEEISGKTALVLSKPGKEFNDIIKQKLGPLDPKRILFIGDSPITDMAFATNFGYQKLLPLSGFTSKEMLEKWPFEEKWKPHYYADTLKDLHTIIKGLGLNDCNL